MSESEEPVAPDRGDRPLDDLMLAMDVVDTLRHRASLVEHELTADDRDQQLIERLRQLYAAQGIDVPDDILAEGVTALREDRFSYQPPPPSWQATLARCYVTRRRWGPCFIGITVLMTVVLLGYWLLVSAPRARRLRELPQQLAAQQESIRTISHSTEATSQAEQLVARGQRALRAGDANSAQHAIAQLAELRQHLEQEYELLIVQQGSTGVWRIPDVNESARNYYIIVQAVTPKGEYLTLPIENEEDGQRHEVDRWGVRVDETTFRKIEADKKDDGIIQDGCFGVKRSGYLEPEYLMPTSGGAITAW